MTVGGVSYFYVTLQSVMSIKSFIKEWSLPVSLCFGTVVYLLFANVPALVPVGDAAEPWLVGMMPVVMFVLLYVTFCKIDISDLRPRAWHFWLQLIRVTLSGLLVWLISQTGDADVKLVLEGVFVCVICPTAAAAAVVTEKLGGSIASMAVYTIIANVVTSVVIPLFFPMVEMGADITFPVAALMVLRNVTSVLVAPLALALVSRRLVPRFTARVAAVKDLAFYMWCFNLAIVTGLTVRNILHSEVSGWVLALLLVLPLGVTLLLFGTGKAVGRAYGDSISAGQALGQKNTVVGIWLTITFLNPLAALAPGAYVVWQNMLNAWQIWYKERHGKLKW